MADAQEGSSAIELRSKYVPRKQFLPFHHRQQRRAAMVAHRQAGKTVACVNELITRAIYSKKIRPRYGYIAPLRNQAKQLAWDYLKYYTEGMTAKVSESELYVEFAHNGARISVYGADNPDAFRGLYFDGIILDEYGDMNPTVYSKVLLPTLSSRQGWIVFIGTPKGRNHFHQIFQQYQLRSDCFTYILRASESGIFSQSDLDLFHSEMTDEEYAQEYECSFDAEAMLGAYYAKHIAWLEANNHISDLIEYDPEFPVEVSSDIGYTDSTALWFWQNRPDGFAIIDYLEESGHEQQYYQEELQKKGYKYAKIWLPHDARAKTFQTGRSTIEQWLSAGWPVDIYPHIARQHGIDAARLILPKCWFHPRCSEGLEALRAYRRKWDETKKVYAPDPMHDWSSHGADAFRGLALVCKERIISTPSEKRNLKQLIPLGEPWVLEELFQEREARMKWRNRHA